MYLYLGLLTIITIFIHSWKLCDTHNFNSFYTRVYLQLYQWLNYFSRDTYKYTYKYMGIYVFYLIHFYLWIRTIIWIIKDNHNFIHIWIGVRVIFKFSLYKMKIKTNLLEEYVNFVDSTKKQNTYLTRIKFFHHIKAIIELSINVWK